MGIIDWLFGKKKIGLDPDNKDKYIYYHNSGSTDVNLDGYFLSDDNENNLGKWQFPNVSIPANGYLVVWLDGQAGLQAGLHAGFKLSADGEELFLSTANLYVVDAIFYGALSSDMAFARIPNGSGPFVTQDHTHNYNNETANFIEEITSAFKVYPNPSRLQFVIEVSFAEDIKVFDLLGKEYLHLQNVQNRVNVNTASWASGTYVVKIGGEVQKIIIQ